MIKLEPPKDKKTSKSSCLKTLFVIIVVILVLLLLEFFLYFVCSLKFTLPRIIAIIFQIILHLLFIRYVVYNILFMGQFWFLASQQIYSMGEEQARFIFKYLSGLFKSFVFLSEKTTEKSFDKITSIKKQTVKCINLINYYLNIFKKMKEKFNLSKY